MYQLFHVLGKHLELKGIAVQFIAEIVQSRKFMKVTKMRILAKEGLEAKRFRVEQEQKLIYLCFEAPLMN